MWDSRYYENGRFERSVGYVGLPVLKKETFDRSEGYVGLTVP